MVTEMNKFKVGDVVTIVTDLEQRDHPPGVATEMLKCQGKSYTIRVAPTKGCNYYKLLDDEHEASGWSWAEDWFEEAYPELNDIEESDLMSMFEV